MVSINSQPHLGVFNIDQISDFNNIIQNIVLTENNDFFLCKSDLIAVHV